MIIMDEVLIPWILAIHAAAGGMALGVAPLAMLVRKGGAWHRRWGKVYFFCMIAVCATAIFMAIVHPRNFWLLLVAVFSFHLVASGYRSRPVARPLRSRHRQPTKHARRNVCAARTRMKMSSSTRSYC